MLLPLRRAAVLGRQRGAYEMEGEGAGASSPREGSPALEFALRPDVRAASGLGCRLLQK